MNIYIYIYIYAHILTRHNITRAEGVTVNGLNIHHEEGSRQLTAIYIYIYICNIYVYIYIYICQVLVLFNK